MNWRKTSGFVFLRQRQPVEDFGAKQEAMLRGSRGQDEGRGAKRVTSCPEHLYLEVDLQHGKQDEHLEAEQLQGAGNHVL